jgi:hypothetical protein
MFKIIALSTLLTTCFSESNSSFKPLTTQVISVIPTDPSLIGQCTIDLNGCVVIPSSTELKEWYQFDLAQFNFATEKDAQKFCGMNSTNLFRLHLDYANQKGYVQLYQTRLGAPTTISTWNTYFTQQCD